MAFCCPVAQINQLAALTAKRPPGIVVPASQAFALWAGVGLSGVVGHWAQWIVKETRLERDLTVFEVRRQTSLSMIVCQLQVVPVKHIQLFMKLVQ